MKKTPERKSTGQPVWHWVKATAGIAVVAVIAIVGRGYLGELGRLRSARPLPILGVAALYLLSRGTFGQVLRVILRRLGHRLTWAESFAAMTLMVCAGLLVSHLAAAIVAAYLYARRRVPAADVGAAFLVMNAAQFACVGLCGLATVAAADGLPSGGLSLGRWPLTALFAAATFAGAGLVLLRFPVRADWVGPVAAFLRRTNSSLDRVGRGRDVVLPATAWQVATLGLRGLRLMIAYQAVDYPMSFAGAMLSSLIADLTVVVQLTPAGLGLREAAIGLAGTAVGVPAEVSVAAALLDRLVWTAAAFLATLLIIARNPPVLVGSGKGVES